jgi:hypothetical protein
VHHGRHRVEVVASRGQRLVVRRAVEWALDHHGGGCLLSRALGGREAQVDRHGDRAEPQTPVQRLHERRPGRQRDRHPRTVPHSQRGKPPRRARCPVVELGIGEAGVGCRQRQALGMHRRGARQPGVDLHRAQRLAGPSHRRAETG